MRFENKGRREGGFQREEFDKKKILDKLEI